MITPATFRRASALGLLTMGCASATPEVDMSTVKRIEVDPSGVAQKPGYDSSRNGLILVFVLNGREG